MQAEARGRVAGGGVDGVVKAARRGNVEAVELHVIADAGVGECAGLVTEPPVHCSPCPRGAAADDG